MNRLEEILRAKRVEIERLRPRATELDRQALQRNDFRSFRSVLKRPDGKLALIAEIKKASPSAGVIAQSFNPVEIARNADVAQLKITNIGLFFLEEVRDDGTLRGFFVREIISGGTPIEPAIAAALVPAGPPPVYPARTANWHKQS